MAEKIFSQIQRSARSRAMKLVASMAAAVLLASGVALGATLSEQPSARTCQSAECAQTFEPGWMNEPVAAQEESFEAASLFAGHWTSVTPKEELYYYNPEKVYPKAVSHGARAWNALDVRFNGRGVRLIKVYSNEKATVLIDGFRDCKKRDWLGYALDRPGYPDVLGVNTCALDGRGRQMREHVLTHELGHHLGSGHHRQRYCEKTIMVKYAHCGSKRIVLTKPGPRDISWYRDRWVK
jgi:hypothetical protein